MVVIAIIGLLGSIVLVATKSVREKARIAKGLQFSSSVHHALGADAVGIWDFNEGSGTTAKDSSGNGNDVTIVGATWSAEGDTPSGSGNALSFDGDGDYVDCGSDTFTTPSEITMCAWFKTSASPGARQRILSIEGYYQLVMDSDYSIYGFVDGSSAGSAQTSLTYNDGNWHHIALTSNGSTSILYVDGIQNESVSEPIGDIDAVSRVTRIGLDHLGTDYFNGTIDEVRIYEEALTSVQVKKLYVEGAEKKGLLSEK